MLILAEASSNHGPGTYGKASTLAAVASFVVGNAAYNPVASTAWVTFRADGSGTFTFHNATAAKPATRAIWAR